MNWTKLLAQAGIPEPPGREEAVAVTLEQIREKYKRTGGPKRARGTSARKIQQVSRKELQRQERKKKGGL